MRYRPPDNLTDYIPDPEFRLLTARGATDRELDARGRKHAWREHREKGPLGRIRALCEGPIGGHVVLPEYQSTPQIGALIASARRTEGARFATRVERHELTEEPIGVRVTFLGFE